AAATTATILIGEFDVDRAVFTGTAGGLHPQARVGDIVVADALLQHDMDATPLFPRHEVPLYGVDRFAADPVLSAALATAAGVVLDAASHEAHDAADAVAEARPAATQAAVDGQLLREFGIASPRVHRGLVVSGDRFVASGAESAELRHRLPDALAVEMEGAALAQVCHDFGVPFAVVRTISDRADDSAHVDFSRFVAAVASRYTLAIMRRWLRNDG
ncbi:MAG TPA: 5'-methylthioadenosine/adenosylhomocysteine nucleosidase, partial [Caldimonas sp.]|nr:5'-methylthioadenosine/adenosylhomocysteine nucleosidase [Caldimonas sp.]